MASQINASNSGFGGIVSTGDSSGVLQLQTTGTTAITVDTSQNTTLAGKLTTASSGIQFSDASIQTAAASPYVLKNRIINGAMVIDQRNAGASVTPTNTQYTLDRWRFDLNQASKFTVQQNAGAVTPPVGFSKYLGVTSSSAYSVGATDYFTSYQPIEGFNTADLSWGTANAKTITISAWVRSSLTGTFGGTVFNENADRCYVFTYSIPTANTWTQISVTIAGDTSGTWTGATNGIGMYVGFAIGAGSTASGTAGIWGSTFYRSATGATSVVGTNGATWYVTGVQLEIGSTATPFERRLYGQELINCQRYYAKLQNDGTGSIAISAGFQISTTVAAFAINFPVTMRAEPTVTVSNLQASDNVNFSSNFTLGSIDMGYNTGYLNGSIPSSGTLFRNVFLFTANNTNGFLALSAEL